VNTLVTVDDNVTQRATCMFQAAGLRRHHCSHQPRLAGEETTGRTSLPGQQFACTARTRSTPIQLRMQAMSPTTIL
jgi:hypothetical protein